MDGTNFGGILISAEFFIINLRRNQLKQMLTDVNGTNFVEILL